MGSVGSSATPIGSGFLFTGRDVGGFAVNELWTTDLTPAGTTKLVGALQLGNTEVLSEFVEFGGLTYFQSSVLPGSFSGGEAVLYRSDGTVGNKELLLETIIENEPTLIGTDLGLLLIITDKEDRMRNAMFLT